MCWLLAVTAFGVSLLLRSHGSNRVNVYCVLSVLSGVKIASWVLPALKLHNSTMDYMLFYSQWSDEETSEAQRTNLPQEPSTLELVFDFTSLAGGLLISPLLLLKDRQEY